MKIDWDKPITEREAILLGVILGLFIICCIMTIVILGTKYGGA